MRLNKRTGWTVLLLCCIIVLIFLWGRTKMQGVPILAYHEVVADDEMYSVDPDQFEAQLNYLKQEGYHSVSLHDVFEAREGRGVLPDKPIVLTFDDGYEDNYTQALPLMEKYGFSGTVFIISSKPDDPDEGEGYLSWDEIRMMQGRHTEIGSHTVNHVALSDLSFAEKQQEMMNSKQTIEKQIGRSVEFLAYPFGAYDKECFELLRNAGYRGACAGVPGYNMPDDKNPYRLKRVNIPRPRFGLMEFKLRILKSLLFSPFT